MRPLFHTSTSRPVSRQLVSLWKINIKKRMTCKACKTTTISARVSIKASRKTGETHEPPSKRAHHVFTATLMFMALTSAGRRIRQALPSSRRKPSLARPRPVPAAVGTADGPGTRLAPMQFRARNQSIGKQGAGRAGDRRRHLATLAGVGPRSNPLTGGFQRRRFFSCCSRISQSPAKRRRSTDGGAGRATHRSGRSFSRRRRDVRPGPINNARLVGIPRPVRASYRH